MPLLILPLLASSMIGREVVDSSSPPDPVSTPMPAQIPGQMPGPDRLEQPVLPESPTQVESGRYLYYFHCMPCHGDRGQGLTDEWRQVWVEDHQNCWGRGCHAGRSEMDAFYLPHVVPVIIGPPQALAAFQTADDLFAFLRETQPPQRPGALSDAEYWDLTAFLLNENDRLAPDARVGPEATVKAAQGSYLILATLAPMFVLLFIPWVQKRRRLD